MLEPTPQQMRRWHDFLQPYFDRFGVDAAAMDAGGLRQPFGDAQLAIVQQYRPAVVSFDFGLPDETLLQRVRNSGAKILCTATTLEEALWLQERFPEAELRDVPGLVKRVSRAEIEANDWSLTPGRYVGVAPEEVDEDFDFEAALRDIHVELTGLNEEAVALAAKIARNFEELGA